MRAKEARELGSQIAARVSDGETESAYAILAPVLVQRTPFANLDLVGEVIGAKPLEVVNALLEQIAAFRTEGGWVVIGSALGQQLGRDLPGAFERCRKHIGTADTWYGADILGERVPGPSILAHFEAAMQLLLPWREDRNVWVRRATGVAVHFWAKRSRGAEASEEQAQALLEFLEPMFGEWELPAVKGVGWGLKTLGRYHPDLMARWLAEEVVPGSRRHRALMLRKALTYLTGAQRARALGEVL